jgi:GntR family transcriptional repressor for pyruvate dehydrogenase complex
LDQWDDHRIVTVQANFPRAATTTLRPPTRRRIHEHVAEQLRDSIFAGRFAPGQRLPAERELAAEFRVNRTSIREAIKVLEGLGLVVVRQGDGAIVRERIEASFDALPGMIFCEGRIDLALLGDLIEVLSPMLLEMGRLAIDRHTPEQFAELVRLRDALSVGDTEDRHAVLREILVLLSDMSGNTLWQMLARRTRSFLEAEPLGAARRRYGRDPARLLPRIDACLEHLEHGRRDVAVDQLQVLLREFYEGMLAEAKKAETEVSTDE